MRIACCAALSSAAGSRRRSAAPAPLLGLAPAALLLLALRLRHMLLRQSRSSQRQRCAAPQLRHRSLSAHIWRLCMRALGRLPVRVCLLDTVCRGLACSGPCRPAALLLLEGSVVEDWHLDSWLLRLLRLLPWVLLPLLALQRLRLQSRHLLQHAVVPALVLLLHRLPASSALLRLLRRRLRLRERQRLAPRRKGGRSPHRCRLLLLPRRCRLSRLAAGCMSRHIPQVSQRAPPLRHLHLMLRLWVLLLRLLRLVVK